MVRPDGRVGPCCLWKAQDDQPTLDENWQEYIEEKRKAFEKGWIPECIECQISEERGQESDRDRSFKKIWNHDTPTPYSHNKKTFWDLKLHNTCNLICRMCSTADSSSWIKIVKENPKESWNEWQLGDTLTNNRKYGWRNKINNLLKLLPEVETLKFTGGEPFMIPQVKQILNEAVKKKLAKNIDVRITSNGTFPLTNEWKDIFGEFKSANFSFSVNGIKSRYEYIRQNAVWEETLENVLEFNKHYQILIAEMSMMLNFDMKKEITDFWHSQGILDITWSNLFDPAYQSLNALPTYLRKKHKWPDYYKFDESLFNEFLQQAEIHDRMTGKDIRKEIPELFVKDLGPFLRKGS